MHIGLKSALVGGAGLSDAAAFSLQSAAFALVLGLCYWHWVRELFAAACLIACFAAMSAVIGVAYALALLSLDAGSGWHTLVVALAPTIVSVVEEGIVIAMERPWNTAMRAWRTRDQAVLLRVLFVFCEALRLGLLINAGRFGTTTFYGGLALSVAFDISDRGNLPGILFGKLRGVSDRCVAPLFFGSAPVPRARRTHGNIAQFHHDGRNCEARRGREARLAARAASDAHTDCTGGHGAARVSHGLLRGASVRVQATMVRASSCARGFKPPPPQVPIPRC